MVVPYLCYMKTNESYIGVYYFHFISFNISYVFESVKEKHLSPQK